MAIRQKRRTLTEIYLPIQSELQATEELLLKELALNDGLLGELTRYVARMPGKRIRPALALLGASLAKKGDRLLFPKKEGQAPAKARRREPVPRSQSPAVRLAVAVEMIHTATLLHDDVIDGASLRRGLSTLNAKWGDTLSVLSGDYLYSKAFCLLSDLGSGEVLRLMSQTARTVCEGEVAQIQHQYDLSLSVSKYLKIIRSKTASLMGASIRSGALLGGATLSQACRLGEFGLNFGLAFQIVDDTQDLLGKEEALGKSLGTDLALGHLTLPLIYLRDRANQRTRDRLTEWFRGNGNGDAQLLDSLKKEALKFQVPVYCRSVAGKFLKKARESLRGFPSSAYKNSLLNLADYL